MRKAFVSKLIEIAEQDERVVLLTADLGFMVLEPFRDMFPNRFINAGVMEQNMIAVATGLSLRGFIPFAYSITTFATMRSYEFIRNGPSVHNLPVRIVGIGTGVDYSFDGLSHYALEDVGLFRTLPNITIISPADSAQTQSALEQTWNLPGPVYYRLSKNDALSVPILRGEFSYKQIQLVKPGKDTILIATGSVCSDVVEASKRLSQQGIDAGVAIVSTLQPFPQRELCLLLSGYAQVFTFEAHAPVGGLGSIIAETITDYNLGCKLVRSGISYEPFTPLGSQAFIHTKNKIDIEGITETVKRVTV